MAKKKKRIIIIATAAALVLALIIAAICLYSWYRRTALSEAIKIGVAISERDAEAVFDSIASTDRKVLNAFMTLLFLDEERALDLIFPEESREDVKSVKLLDYTEEGDRAEVEIIIIYKDKTEQELTLTFIKEDGEWRLSVGELIGDLLVN